MSSGMSLNEVDEYRANAQERWQEEIDALGNMSSEEAFTHLIFIDSMLSMQYEAFNLKVSAAVQDQYATDEGLASQMDSDYTTIGNAELAIYNDQQVLNDPNASQADKNAATTDIQNQNMIKNNAAQNENECAAQLDYDLNYSGAYSQGTIDTMEAAIGAVIPDEGAWSCSNGATPDPDNQSYINDTNTTQSNQWLATEPQFAQDGSVTKNGDPSQVDQTNNEFQTMQDQFSGLNNSIGVRMRMQKSNISMTQSLIHTVDSSYISSEKTMVQNGLPS